MALSRKEMNSEPATGVTPDRRRSPSKAQHRILYAVGPGDVVGLYRDLLEGREPPFQMGMAFSRQFLDWCDESGAQAHLMSWHARRDSLQVGPHRVENRPKSSLYFARGIRHHIGALLYGLTVVAQALRDRATVVVVDSGTTHWLALSLLWLLRIPVIAVLYSALWPAGFPPSRFPGRLFARILLASDGLFFRRIAAATVCISPECERQVRQVAGTPTGPIHQFCPQYRQDFMSRVVAVPDHGVRPFRVLFLGRIEEFKGVYLILSMAERLEKELPGQFVWKIVGSGPASEALGRRIVERKLGTIVEACGQLRDERQALETMGWAHAMVAPTTSQFQEGLAMTAVEAVLAGRPVVLSAVVPAWEVLGGAAIKVETDNVDSFVETFRRLALDRAYYDACRSAAATVRAPFYDRSQGLGNVLGRAISALD